MNIPSLKSKLDILQIGEALGIKIDKHGKAHCPFHNDKTPSFQFSKEKQIATCFSANCSAGTMDVVELVKKYKSLELPKALDWLQERTNGVGSENLTQTQTITNPNYQSDFQQMQSSFLASSTARKYAESRNLDWKSLEIGYNAFKSSRFNYLRGCITFPLKNEKGDIVSLYGRSVRSTGGNHFYSKNRTGLYPGYPNRETKKLILTESVIDTATLLNIKEITESYALLSLYGTNGLTAEHIHAIQQIESLEELILFFDGDQSGKEANLKHAKYLKSLFSETTIRIVPTPEGTDINELSQSHQPELFTDLIQKSEVFFFSKEETEELKENESTENKKLPESTQNTYKLDTNHKYNLKYQTDTAKYEIKGGIGKNGLDRLVISLHIIHLETRKKSRVRLDLYEDKQVEKIARESSEKLELRADLLEQDLNYLADLLDEYREEQIKEKENAGKAEIITLTQSEKEEYLRFGKSADLIAKINELIGKSGVVGEEKSRLFLFCGAVSHKMMHPLNIVVQGSSGSGKSYLIKQVSGLVPQEKVRQYTRLSEKGFYNFGENELINTLIIIEDYDGLGEEAEYGFRELQSNGKLVSGISGKESDYAQIETRDKVVLGPIASMVATTNGSLYHDNATRVFFIAVDESTAQTQRIIDYKNRLASGEVAVNKQEEAKNYLQGFVRTLQPLKVSNPFLSKIKLPVPPDQLRRLHELLSSFCEQITLLYQHQRKRTKSGALLTDKKDMEIAIDLLFDSIVLKVDELDGRLRLFYERLKKYIEQKGKDYEFTRLEIRQHTQLSNTQLHRYMSDLLDLEYIYQSSGYSNRGFKYKISFWDDNQKLRKGIKEELESQLNTI